ncbi:peptidoglycan/xylan/chitin deacetylase (PgdA/CDA1 family) [Paenibacillus sp. BK033]|uniref:polysaccharide deacetylase family protein n=1 Tax=Paenibacillus sp. BK033 TaxID=2512133 RepID=UPI00104DD55D|nr:polysaccharide deacetylase family protein [Paenibacillus sp. BK033]TCM95771.1 peptidoglycan/xylan/chitin deacetylase (PgdA/CDA1 family) [Paenibacillus sp. BK033]
MRLLVRTGLCLVVLWFGLLGAGPVTEERGEAASELAQAGLASEMAAAATRPAAYQEEGAGSLIRADQLVDYSAEEAKTAAVKPTVYLTFDDGPSGKTKDVLAILKREGVKATFFMLGKEVKQYPDIARQVVKEGHAIGNHTYDHVYKELYSSFSAFAKQVMDTDDEIYKVTGVRTNLLRAPGGTFGNFDQGYYDALAKAGYIVNDWNVDSGDSARVGVPAKEIVSTVKGSRLSGKVVVLMHDSSIHGESVKALPEVIGYFKNKGYQFAVLTEQVKPIQFRLAPTLKWKRPKVTAQETQTLVQYTARTRTNLPELNTHSLIIHAGGDEIPFAPQDYKTLSGTIDVPLRQLAIGLHGIIRLDMANGVVEAMVNNQSVSWTAAEVGGSGTSLPSRIIVHLRETLQRFHFGISRITVTEGKREIWIGPSSL